MAEATSGRVVYSRTVHPASYESERAEVELAFVVAEGEDASEIAAYWGHAAKTQALALIGKSGGSKPPDRAKRFRKRWDE